MSQNRIKIPWKQDKHSGKWSISDEQNEMERLFAKLDTSVKEVFSIIRPILQAGGAAKPQDRAALRETVFKLSFEKFSTLSYDELHAVVTSIFADRIMQDVASRPWGDNNPDLLSGK